LYSDVIEQWSITMTKPITIGIEEEFQTVDRQSGQLCSRIQTLLEKGRPLFGEQIKAELLQPTVELISDILPDLETARHSLRTRRTQLAALVAEEGLCLISAGTHPSAMWQEEPRTPSQRYLELEEEFQDAARRLLIFGLHVHIGLPNMEMAVTLMNQVRTFLPHLLALSTNSPFWSNRLTGLKSYRSVVWKALPRNGIPEIFASRADFDGYVQALVQTGCIDNGKRIWWDIRPHPFFNTLEFRICDMPATLEDTLAIAALCQALVAKLSWLNTHDKAVPALSSHFLEENKWRVIHLGLDAQVIDFVKQRRLRMREAVAELLDFVEEVAQDLGSQREFAYLHHLIASPLGTGADRQMALYQQTESLDAVTRLLMEQTMQDIPFQSPIQVEASE
jgi:carboxylate-amine ligase